MATLAEMEPVYVHHSHPLESHFPLVKILNLSLLSSSSTLQGLPGPTGPPGPIGANGDKVNG